MTPERPILFSAPMVRAILDGRKSMTRRVVKPQPGAGNHIDCSESRGWHLWWDVVDSPRWDVRQEYAPLRCPYGQPGDLLYVRETWQVGYATGEWDRYSLLKPSLPDPALRVFYRADYPDGSGPPKWRPGIHMPKAHARIWLRVTDVRVDYGWDANPWVWVVSFTPHDPDAKPDSPRARKVSAGSCTSEH